MQNHSIASDIINGEVSAYSFPPDPDAPTPIHINERRLHDERLSVLYQELLRRSVYFDVSNVQEYAWRELENADQISKAWKQLPNLLPPYESMWVEWTQPSSVVPHVGCLISSMKVNKDGPYPSNKEVPELLKSFRSGESLWYVSLDLFLRVRGQTYGPFMRAQLGLAEDGSLISGPWFSSTFFVDVNDPIADGAKSMQLLTYIPAMAISLLHCKNVREGELLDIRSRQQRRLADRKRINPIKFKTLIVGTSMKQEPGRVGGGGIDKVKMPMHIVRGNFAHYTEDKPLFGKYTGTFWRPAHVRGSADVGTVYKDYKVKP